MHRWFHSLRAKLRLPAIYQLYRMDPEETLLLVEEGAALKPDKSYLLTTLRAHDPQRALVQWMQMLHMRSRASVHLQQCQAGVWIALIQDTPEESLALPYGMSREPLRLTA